METKGGGNLDGDDGAVHVEYAAEAVLRDVVREAADVDGTVVVDCHSFTVAGSNLLGNCAKIARDNLCPSYIGNLWGL